MNFLQLLLNKYKIVEREEEKVHIGLTDDNRVCALKAIYSTYIPHCKLISTSLMAFEPLTVIIKVEGHGFT